MRLHLVGSAAVLPVALFFLLPVVSVRAACLIEQGPGPPEAPLTLHLRNSCSPQEREARAVPASQVLAAFKAGRGVDLRGVVIQGDLMLDALPFVPVRSLTLTAPPLQERIRRQGLTQVRMISGPMSIRDSVVHGTIATNLQEGLLIVTGPVTMTGSTFERMVDFSRTAFLEPVDFSDAVLLRQGFFIHALFEKPVRFEKTSFGIHSRFHKAMFGDTVTFRGAGFNGLAEFLEVSFEKSAGFAHTSFKMGTGFSGSRFGGTLDFSEAVFEREAFFLFAVFNGDAYFRRSTFRAEADFSDAEFHGVDDFSRVLFEKGPRFARAKVRDSQRSPGRLQDARVLYLISAVLLAFTLIFVFLLRKR